MPTPPEVIVQRQLDAYNAKDLDAFMRLWREDAEIFEHPATLVARGTEQIRERHRLRFTEPNLHGRLLQRLVMGPMVVDHERVTRTFPEGPGQLEVIVTYEVRGELLARSWVLLGPRTLDGHL
jgi:hypothetical protein